MKKTIISAGATLGMLLIPASHAAEVTVPQREPKLARYCTGCATVQAVRRSAAKYELTVRYQSGDTRTLTYDNDPGFRAGDKVRVIDSVLTRDQ